MPIGVQKLDRNLAAGAPATLIVDDYIVCAQMVAGPDDFVQACDFKRHVMQRGVAYHAIKTADERKPVMIRVKTHEYHAARHHRLRVYVRHRETQHLGIKRD